MPATPGQRNFEPAGAPTELIGDLLDILRGAQPCDAASLMAATAMICPPAPSGTAEPSTRLSGEGPEWRVRRSRKARVASLERSARPARSRVPGQGLSQRKVLARSLTDGHRHWPAAMLFGRRRLVLLEHESLATDPPWHSADAAHGGQQPERPERQRRCWRPAQGVPTSSGAVDAVCGTATAPAVLCRIFPVDRGSAPTCSLSDQH